MIAALVLAATGAVCYPRARKIPRNCRGHALEHSFRGHATDKVSISQVFHPDAKLFAVRDGKYWQLTSEQYIATLRQTPG